jgi:hypothetical protein
MPQHQPIFDYYFWVLAFAKFLDWREVELFKVI